MRAWVLYGANDLRLEEVPTPVPRPGEVLVSVKAAGICGSDIPRIYRTGESGLCLRKDGGLAR